MQERLIFKEIKLDSGKWGIAGFHPDRINDIDKLRNFQNLAVADLVFEVRVIKDRHNSYSNIALILLEHLNNHETFYYVKEIDPLPEMHGVCVDE